MKYLVFLIVEFAVVVAAVVAGCVGWSLWRKGVAYAHLAGFTQDVHFFIRVGLGVAVIVSLIQVCYSLTVRTVEEPD
ncbi:MAG TPA: hypothetical protein VG839_00635 [Asticcacaulis sp.]|nr:hypothetical protein [Asticcacaulis sp.]